MLPVNRSANGVLYISYDGLMEPLGQSQVWQYLSGLSVNHKIILISYEKAADWANKPERERIKAAVRAKGVIWIPLRYHKKPSAVATAFDIYMGTLVALYLTLRYRVKIVHARSYVPSVIAFPLKKLLGVKYIFDMRGFWADERVDGGLWPKDGRLYRVAKWFERRFLLAADRVVSLTQAAVKDMQSFPYLQGRMPKFEVITTCADLDLFKPGTPDPSLQKDIRPFTLGYVGSVGVWYLFDETLQFFKLLRQVIPNARLDILNRGDHIYILERLNVHQIDLQAVQLEVTDHVGVAHAMCRMDAGIFFYKSAYSKMATAPTKLGEFLGCGIPCVGNTGVGDMAAILAGENVGVVLCAFDDEAYAQGVQALLKLVADVDTKSRCINVAKKYFALEQGVKAYDRIYQELS